MRTQEVLHNNAKIRKTLQDTRIPIVPVQLIPEKKLKVLIPKNIG